MYRLGIIEESIRIALCDARCGSSFFCYHPDSGKML